MKTAHSPSKPRVSLTTWIMALVAVPVLAAGGGALLAMAQHPENENDRAAAAALGRVAPAVDQTLDREGEYLASLGAMIAQDPKFFAVLTLPRSERGRADFKNALEGVLIDFQRDAQAPVFAVTDEKGSLLARAQRPATDMTDLSGAPFVREAAVGRNGHGYLVEKGRIYRVAAVPVVAGGIRVGTLCLGRPVDTELGQRIKVATESDVAFTVGDGVIATTLPPSPLRKVVAQRVNEGSLTGSGRARPERREADGSGEVDVVTAAGARFVALRRQLDGSSAVGGTPGFLLIRPLTSASSPLAAVRRELLYAGGLGLLLAILAGGVIAFAVWRLRRRMQDAHREELERLAIRDRMRSTFIASAAEEVLEPASTIGTVSDLIADGALGELGEPQREGLHAIRRAAGALARLGHDLSNLSLLDRRELPLALDRVDVGAIVEEAAVEAMPLASERRQVVTVSIEPNLHHPSVDPKHLSKAVLNLVLDAVRHSREGGTVEVAARRIEHGIRIYVSDAGPEASAGDEAIAPISEPTRLGLAVAFGIVEAHGGTVRMWDEIGAGTAVSMDLPSPRAPEAENAAASLALAS